MNIELKMFKVPTDLIIYVWYQLLEDTSNGAPFGNRKSGKSSSSIFSLFNLKEKSRFWSESVIRTGRIIFPWSSFLLHILLFALSAESQEYCLILLCNWHWRYAEFDDLESSKPSKLDAMNFTKAGTYSV